MERNYLQVPKGIRYLSDWKEFSLNNFPNKCIIDKQLPGCGFTEYCITCEDDIVLCSPRKKLIKNKFDQHPIESFLVVREDESDPGTDKDISKDKKVNEKVEKAVEDSIIETENRIQSFMDRLKYCTKLGLGISEDDLEGNTYKKLYFELKAYINKMKSMRRPCKILVTYDSYRLVREILINLGIFESFKTVVDEFQSILHDSRFKSDTEIGFLEYLKQSPTTYFVSATPMLDDYIEMLDEFNGLPYFELDWKTLDPERIVKPNLKVLTMKSTGEKAAEVIQKYLDGDLEKVVIQDKDTGELKEVVSDEAVLFMNSVNHIISIIKRMGLIPDQVTILCSDTETNRKKIARKLGKKFLACISDIPLKGVKPKMFTFCTRTTYLGADFYSLCARTFIFSDANLDCLAVDISDDLPQILGRQRLEENPWKNSATFYYRTTSDWRSKGEDVFRKEIEKKISRSKNLLDSFNLVSSNCSSESEQAWDLAITYENLSKYLNYKIDYVAVNRIRLGDDKFELVPVFNNLVYVNELRAFKIAQIDYKDRFSVFSGIREKLGKTFTNRPDEGIVVSFLREYDSLTTILERYRLLCENDLSKDTIEYILSQLQDSDIVKSNYIALGPKKLRNLGYKKKEIEKELGNKMFDKNLVATEIFHKFNIGDSIPLIIIKDGISDIYSRLKYNKTPKATDLKDYFEIKDTKIWRDIDGSGIKKKVNAYNIISVKPEYQDLYSNTKVANKLAEEYSNFGIEE